ncbi:MAG TPA: energy transducer TonB [Bryobacteraceae bacterium]|jgi:TonB family protein
MKKILMSVVALASGWAAFTLLPAQEPAPVATKMKVAIKGTVGFGTPVTGAPYSAVAITETTQTLGDGNRIIQSESQRVYRDSQGRERSEQLTANGVSTITISDFEAKTAYRLNPQDRTAVQTPATAVALARAVGALTQFRLSTGGQTIEIYGTAPAGGRGGAAQTAKTETLPSLNIEGLSATGTRITSTIPAGEIGNQLPISVVDETWYSPDLKMNIMTKHSDPRTGENTFRLTQISRAEPDPQLFQVPPDYTITGNVAAGAVAVAGGRGGGRSGPAPQAVAVPAVPGANKVGGAVMMSKLITKVDPQYTDQARAARWQGTVTLDVVIDETGKPTDLKVVKPLGLGLDEQAMMAVVQWRFQPTMLNGTPVKVQTQIEVPFRLQ